MTSNENEVSEACIKSLTVNIVNLHMGQNDRLFSIKNAILFQHNKIYRV